jgi:hypothetical protein
MRSRRAPFESVFMMGLECWDGGATNKCRTVALNFSGIDRSSARMQVSP